MPPKSSQEAVPVGQPAAEAAAALDPDQPLCVATWNVHKLQHDGIHQELDAICLARQPHILALQEARHDMATPYGMTGHHATSFRSALAGGSQEGVMTLSPIAALRAHRIRSSQRELLVLTPKAALVSFFPVAGGQELCFINLHGLNFDPTGVQLGRQLTDLAKRVGHLSGPLIIAGDFNTWNDSRMKAVDELSQTLDLVEVRPDYPGGKTGDLPKSALSKAVGFDPEMHLDRMFVRGFRAQQVSWMMEYEASDHVPLIARLEWTPS